MPAAARHGPLLSKHVNQQCDATDTLPAPATASQADPAKVRDLAVALRAKGRQVIEQVGVWGPETAALVPVQALLSGHWHASDDGLACIRV